MSKIAIAVGGSPGVCETTTSSTCQPNAQNPCVAADDCGPGYDCVDQTSCGCSAGAAGGASGFAPSNPVGGAGPSTGTAVPADCVCSSTGVKGCQAQTIACVATSDCPETWTCAGSLDSNGNILGDCQPPYQYFGGGTVNNGHGGATGVAGGTAVVGGTPVPEDTGGSPATNPMPYGDDTVTPPHSQGGCQISHGEGTSLAAILMGILATLGIRRSRRPV